MFHSSMGDYDLRPFRLMNHTAVTRLFSAETDLNEWAEYDWLATLARPHQTVYVATTADQTVIGCVLAQTFFDECEIMVICVAPAWRGQGIAQQLMTVVIDQPSVKRVLLEVAADNQSARRCYSRGGYQQYYLRPNYYQNGADALLLEKWIND